MAQSIKITDDCWLWGKSCTPGGYGRIYIGHKGFTAHKVIYETLVGKIPKGYELDHLCRNRACINPEHLEPVTHRENVLRGKSVAAFNAKKSCCKNGHKFTSENTYFRLDKYARECRICRQNSSNKYRLKIRYATN